VIRESKSYFQSLTNVLQQLPFELLDHVSSVLYRAYLDRKTIFTFGNGGSASLASHMACDLGKGTVLQSSSKRVRVIALTDNVPTITAWANDSSYEDIFSEQLKNLANPGDVAIAISGSGNSPNVLKGLSVAQEMQLTKIGIGGFDGGKMKALCDISLIVPSNNMQIVEDMHLCIAHCLFTVLRNQIAEPVPIRAAAAAIGMSATRQI
jgi:D-sedoheptulose 7-phosphate isomerase